jgi:hypothetical protein
MAEIVGTVADAATTDVGKLDVRGLTAFFGVSDLRAVRTTFAT